MYVCVWVFRQEAGVNKYLCRVHDGIRAIISGPKIALPCGILLLPHLNDMPGLIWHFSIYPLN